MKRKKFEEIMKITKVVCIVFSQICFFGGGFLGIFIFPPGNFYQLMVLLIWVVGVAVYILHYQFVPFFIEKILNTKITDDLDI